MYVENAVNSGEPVQAILSQALKEEGATIISKESRIQADSKRGASHADDDMIWSAWKHAAAERRHGNSESLGTNREEDNDFSTENLLYKVSGRWIFGNTDQYRSHASVTLH